MSKSESGFLTGSILLIRNLKRKAWIWLAAGFAVLVLAVALWPQRLPACQGKTLDEWLSNQNISGVGGPSPACILIPWEDRHAIRQMGENVFPILVEWVRFEQPGWKLELAKFCRRWPQITRSHRVDCWLQSEKEVQRAEIAAALFSHTGWDATPAVPGLARALRSSKSESALLRILYCLSYIGPSAEVAIPDLEKLAQASSTTKLSSQARITVRDIKAAVESSRSQKEKGS